MKQEESSMIFQILKATRENPVKNDFVYTCQKYLKTLEIDISFEEIAKMSQYNFKQILKEKATIAAFKYLKITARSQYLRSTSPQNKVTS